MDPDQNDGISDRVVFTVPLEENVTKTLQLDKKGIDSSANDELNIDKSSSEASCSSGYHSIIASNHSSSSSLQLPFREDEISVNTNDCANNGSHAQTISLSSVEELSKMCIVDSEAGSLESYIRSSETKPLKPLHFSNEKTENVFAKKCHSIAKYIVHLMNQDGICVVDNFLGAVIADRLLCKIQSLYDLGVFRDGQLVVQSGHTQRIRGDKITWADGSEPGMELIGYLISHLDALMVLCNGQLQPYDINGRTKAMIACYPGNGTKYVKHVDNPHKDGRCITFIYYLNKSWDVSVDGGLLKLYPHGKQKVADIVPTLDRLICFWSDWRNPHEVIPTWRARYAITVWYFDSKERDEAFKDGRIKRSGSDPKYQSSSLAPDFNW